MTKKQIVRQVTANEARTLMDKGALLIDVRESVELMAKKVPSANHHPLSSLRTPIETNGAKAAIFFCASGARTNSYATKLAQMVTCDAYMLVGGIHALSSMGVKTESSNKLKLFGLGAGLLVLVGWATGTLPGL
ncbi:MAG: rhodanese-like domain-containing protein [Cohaesibacter sp.]|nr:rhodanese-like domain-containing protein [Cohaesibacter sp.]